MSASYILNAQLFSDCRKIKKSVPFAIIRLIFEAEFPSNDAVLAL